MGVERNEEICCVRIYTNKFTLPFVGLSRIRETNVFGGLPIAERRDELVCGVGVIDLRSGTTVATFRIKSGVEEIFDVQVAPLRCLALSGPKPDVDETPSLWVVPTETNSDSDASKKVHCQAVHQQPSRAS